MHVNDHKIQDMWLENVENGFLSFYEVNQYHTKSSISVFLLEKST